MAALEKRLNAAVIAAAEGNKSRILLFGSEWNKLFNSTRVEVQTEFGLGDYRIGGFSLSASAALANSLTCAGGAGLCAVVALVI